MPNPNDHKLRIAVPAGSLLVAFLLTAMITRSDAYEILYEGLPTGPGVILEDRDDQVYVAVYGDHGIVIRNSGDAGSWEVWQRGAIHGLQIMPDGDVWIAQDGQIVRYPRRAARAPVSRTPAFKPWGTPGALLATRWGDLWCAGCPAVKHGDGRFETAPPGPPGWTLVPRCDDPFGNTWAIAENGPQQDLAVLNRQHPHAWRRIDLSTEPSAGRWEGVCADDAGYIWIGRSRSVLRVDPRSKEGYLALSSPIESGITAVARIAGGQVSIGFADGSVRELIAVSGQEPQWRTVMDTGTGPVQAMLHDRRGRFWILAGGRLLRTDALRATWQEHWEEQPRMPAGNHDHIFAPQGERLYTAGGKTFFGWPASTWVHLDHVWSYDTALGTWRVEPPMLEPGKAYSGIAPLDGELWILGGLIRTDEGTRPTASVEIYDPRSRKFRLGPPLPDPAGQVVALTVDGRLYAIGGAGDEGPSPQALSIVAGETNWIRHTSAPGPVVQASGCVLDGRIYIAAGPASRCPGLFVYDPQQDAWSQVEHPTSPPSAPLCAAFNGEVWVMGGRGDGRGRVETFAYAPDSGRWRRGPDLPLPVSWAAAAEVGGRLLIAGGAYRDERTDGFFNSDRVFLMRSGKEPK